MKSRELAVFVVLVFILFAGFAAGVQLWRWAGISLVAALFVYAYKDDLL